MGLPEMWYRRRGKGVLGLRVLLKAGCLTDLYFGLYGHSRLMTTVIESYSAYLSCVAFSQFDTYLAGSFNHSPERPL